MAVFSLFGVKDDKVLGWRRMLALVDHLELTSGWAQATQVQSQGRRIRAFVVDAQRELGQRVDMMRRSTRPDAPVVRSMLHPESAPLASLHEFATATAERMKRARQDGEADGRTVRIKLPKLGNAAATGSYVSAVSSSGAPAASAQLLPTVTVQSARIIGKLRDGKGQVEVAMKGGPAMLVPMKLDALNAELQRRYKALADKKHDGICLQHFLNDKRCPESCKAKHLHGGKLAQPGKEGFDIKPYLVHCSWPANANRSFAP